MKLPGSLRLLELEEGIIGIRGKGVGGEQVKSMHIHSSSNIHSVAAGRLEQASQRALGASAHSIAEKSSAHAE